MFRKKHKSQPARKPIYTAPADVFSYHSNRPPDAGGQRARKEPVRRPAGVKRWIRLIPSLISAAVIAGSAIYSTSLSTLPRLQVNSTLPAPLLREANTYETEISHLLKKSLLSYSKLTVNTNKLAREVMAQYPELGHVTVIIPLSGRRPVVEVKPAQPVIKLSGSGGIFIIDEQGRALINTGDIEPGTDLRIPYVVDQSGLQLEKGKQILPISTMDFISEVTVQLQSKGLIVESIILPALHNELHLRVAGLPYYVKFDTQGSAREQAGTFIAAQVRLQADGNTPLEYIDVRVPEKAFYR